MRNVFSQLKSLISEIASWYCPVQATITMAAIHGNFRTFGYDNSESKASLFKDSTM